MIDSGDLEQDMLPVDMALPDDMETVDLATPSTDSTLEDASIVDIDASSDMWINDDQEVIEFDQGVNRDSTVSGDSGETSIDQGGEERDQNSDRINLDQFRLNPDMDTDDINNIDLGQSGPAPFDPESGYDPQVFRRDRSGSGCQAQDPLLASRSHSRLLLLLLLICYALSRRYLTRGSAHE
jgi:hypothetical protein